MNDGLTLPLEVLSSEGSLVGILLMNAKSHNKSLERGELWVVVPPGDRVLPIDGTKFSRLEVVEGHRYRVRLADGAAPAVTAALNGAFARLAATDPPLPRCDPRSEGERREAESLCAHHRWWIAGKS